VPSGCPESRRSPFVQAAYPDTDARPADDAPAHEQTRRWTTRPPRDRAMSAASSSTLTTCSWSRTTTVGISRV
jgi:hypothetical protein